MWRQRGSGSRSPGARTSAVAQAGNAIVDGGVRSNFPIRLIAEPAPAMGDTDPHDAGSLALVLDERLPVPSVSAVSCSASGNVISIGAGLAALATVTDTQFTSGAVGVQTDKAGLKFDGFEVSAH